MIPNDVFTMMITLFPSVEIIWQCAVLFPTHIQKLSPKSKLADVKSGGLHKNTSNKGDTLGKGFKNITNGQD